MTHPSMTHPSMTPPSMTHPSMTHPSMTPPCIQNDGGMYPDTLGPGSVTALRATKTYREVHELDVAPEIKAAVNTSTLLWTSAHTAVTHSAAKCASYPSPPTLPHARVV